MIARLVVGIIALLSVLVGARRGVAAAGRRAAPADGGGVWRRGLGLLALLLAVAGVGGLVVMGSGIIPNRASDGHWAVTEWFLSTATRQSVATQSLLIEAPPLDDPALVLKGAGHFDTGCSPCHGNPDNRKPSVAGQMTPSPPYLAEVVGSWTAPQLFYIVKHGIKFAGMPSWPALERDDEVWAMVAFLQLLPGLDEAAYRALVHGDAPGSAEPVELQGLLEPREAAGAVRTSCGRCHGADGWGRNAGAFPRLAGQREVYLAAALQAYAAGARPSGVMEPVAAGLDRDEIAALARYYARLPPAPPLVGGDPAAIERGRRIALRGVPRDRVPACAACHGPAEQAIARNEHYPRLAGQYANYLELQLELFQQGKRGGSPYGHVMRHVGISLTKEQMRDAALFYASLAPGSD